VYEMMAGYPPFYDDDPLATYKKILKGALTFPAHFSVTARDLVHKLLQVRGRCRGSWEERRQAGRQAGTGGRAGEQAGRQAARRVEAGCRWQELPKMHPLLSGHHLLSCRST
jgi:serine/threonine protein kinase